MRQRSLAGKRNAFTMIEIIVVLIIIGILAAVALPKLTSGGEGAYLATMKSDASNARAAMTNFYAETGDYASVTVDGTNGATQAPIDSTKSNVTVAASDGNTVTITAKDCGDGTRGYDLSVTSTKTSKTISFDSCTDAAITVN